MAHDYEHAEHADAGSEPISPELDQLTCDAIGMALDKLAEGEGIWPTVVLLDEDGSSEYFVFEDDGLDVCLIQARGAVAEMGCETARCYVVYYDGFFEDGDGLSDNALVVEFGERGSQTAYSAIVPYGNAGDPEDFWYDEAFAGGEEENLLRRP